MISKLKALVRRTIKMSGNNETILYHNIINAAEAVRDGRADRLDIRAYAYTVAQAIKLLKGQKDKLTVS